MLRRRGLEVSGLESSWMVKHTGLDTAPWAETFDEVRSANRNYKGRCATLAHLVVGIFDKIYGVDPSTEIIRHLMGHSKSEFR